MEPRELIEKIRALGRGWFTTEDVLQALGSERQAQADRLLSKSLVDGQVKELSQGIYLIDGEDCDFLNVALAMYQPSYLSFEWALFSARHVLNQGGYTITMATRQPEDREIVILDCVTFSYISIPPELYWGFHPTELFASPEKALIDYSWLVLRGEVDPLMASWSPYNINKKKLGKLMAKLRDAGMTELAQKTAEVFRLITIDYEREMDYDGPSR